MAQIIGEYFPWMVVEDSEDSPQHIEKLQRRQCELRDLDLANDQVLRREWNALIMHLDNCLRLNYGVNNDLDDDVDHHHRSKPARYMPKSKSAHQVNGLNDDDNDDEDEDEGDDQDSVTPYVSSDESPTRLRTTAQDIDFLSPPPSEIITNTWSKSSKKSKASKFNIDFFDDEDEVVDEEVDNNILEEFENVDQNLKADEQLKKFIKKKKSHSKSSQFVSPLKWLTRGKQQYSPKASRKLLSQASLPTEPQSPLSSKTKKQPVKKNPKQIKSKNKTGKSSTWKSKSTSSLPSSQECGMVSEATRVHLNAHVNIINSSEVNKPSSTTTRAFRKLSTHESGIHFIKPTMKTTISTTKTTVKSTTHPTSNSVEQQQKLTQAMEPLDALITPSPPIDTETHKNNSVDQNNDNHSNRLESNPAIHITSNDHRQKDSNSATTNDNSNTNDSKADPQSSKLASTNLQQDDPGISQGLQMMREKLLKLVEAGKFTHSEAFKIWNDAVESAIDQ